MLGICTVLLMGMEVTIICYCWECWKIHFLCQEYIHSCVMKSTTLRCWESNFDLYFKTSFIACVTRKQSVTRLPPTQHTSASRTIPHSWNTFNLREWHDLRYSLAVILPLYMLLISVIELTHWLLIDTVVTTRVTAVAYCQNLEKTELQLRETYLICARII
jgi:hypothetical protein